MSHFSACPFCTFVIKNGNASNSPRIQTMLLLLRHFSHVWLCVQPHRRQPTRLPHPWDSPGKNTGVGCHFLLQCRKVKSESEVAQLCPTHSDPMHCSLPGSSVHGIFQARVLEWGAIAFCKLIYLWERKKTLIVSNWVLEENIQEDIIMITYNWYKLQSWHNSILI